MSDLSIKILEKIHAEISGMRDEMRDQLRTLNTKLDQTNERLDHVIVMIGTHHSTLESRVDRIEKHLGLT